MSKSLKRYTLIKLTQKQIENLNRLIFMKNIEIIIQNYFFKKSAPVYMVDFY